MMKTFVCLSLFCAVSASAADLTVRSSSLSSGGTIGIKYVANGLGCSGGNVSPEIQWKDVPKEAKFFAVTMFDPDAPTGSGWWHWGVINIPSNVFSLAEGAGSSKRELPQGAIQTRNDAGASEYGGPCPPLGAKPHRYVITVYALKDKVPLDSSASGAMVGFYIGALKVAEGKFEAFYGR